MKKDILISDKAFTWCSYAVIIAFSLFPILFSLPFRIHLDLPYEGAYRMYIGQVPFKDFAIPFGYGFLIVPTLFFHIFGPNLFSLIYAQVFLNILSGLAVMSILKSLKIEKSVIFIASLVYCLSYIFIYFWPWHTHTAYTYGILAIALILKQEKFSGYKQIGLVALAALFSFLSFFTKQDYGGLNLLFCGTVLLLLALYSKNIKPLIVFCVSYALIACAFIVPLLKYGFGYWFNHGQPPHTARLELIDFLNEIFMGSDWEKFYLLAIVLILVSQLPRLKEFIQEKYNVLAIIICIGMILEALLTKVTSRMSTTITTYYHAFALAIILSYLAKKIPFNKAIVLAPFLLFLFLWWSPMYWKYASRMFPLAESKIPRRGEVAKVQKAWELSEFRTLKKIKIPTETIQGMRKLKEMSQFSPSAKVMNMTELTSLPVELNYTPISGIPLWYDVGVAIFPKQIDEICTNVQKKEYDVFLFEEVPSLPGFYPEEVRDCLKKNYKLVDTFLAPRKEEDATIEVYIKP
jgi:hypothetical protein